MTEFDLDLIIGENVALLTAKLPEMSDEQLAALLQRESDGVAPRVTLKTAIQAEQKGRADLAAEVAAEGAGDAPAAAEVAAEGAGDAPDADLSEEKSDPEAAPVIAEVEAERAALADENEKLKAEIAALKKAAKPVKEKNPKSVKMVLGDVGDAFTVVFADENDDSIVALPPLFFDADAFVPGTDGSKVLDHAISFPVSGPPNDVYSIWAVGKDGKTGMRCQLLMPVGTGGGRMVELPARSLRFAAA